MQQFDFELDPTDVLRHKLHLVQLMLEDRDRQYLELERRYEKLTDEYKELVLKYTHTDLFGDNR